jgi:hypothetical protein
VHNFPFQWFFFWTPVARVRSQRQVCTKAKWNRCNLHTKLEHGYSIIHDAPWFVTISYVLLNNNKKIIYLFNKAEKEKQWLSEGQKYKTLKKDYILGEVNSFHHYEVEFICRKPGLDLFDSFLYYHWWFLHATICAGEWFGSTENYTKDNSYWEGICFMTGSGAHSLLYNGYRGLFPRG